MEYKHSYFKDHIHEVLHYGHKLFNKVGEAGGCQKYQLDYDTILQAEKDGYFFSVGAFEEDKLKGFIGGYKFPHLHHKGVLYACSDVMYVDESLGNKRVKVLKELIKKFEEIAKEIHKVEYVQINVNANNDIRKLIEKLGYVHTDYLLTKRTK